MKIKELRDKSEDELTQLLRELEEELFNLRSRKTTAQLDKPHKFKEVHKTIARIKTIFNERAAIKPTGPVRSSVSYGADRSG